jgi:hypothetical protein
VVVKVVVVVADVAVEVVIVKFEIIAVVAGEVFNALNVALVA